MRDTTEKCFICGIEKNTFNRTLDREAFRVHTKKDQNLWNYIFFIIYIWENDKDDDDGLETHVRKCVAKGDLSWFPMNKAIRLAEHQEKGDVNSLRYKFRKDLSQSESVVTHRMHHFKDQIARSIARIEQSIELDNEAKIVGRSELSRLTRKSTERSSRSVTAQESKQADDIDDDWKADYLSIRVLSISGTNISRNLYRSINLKIVTLAEESVLSPEIIEFDAQSMRGSRAPFSFSENADNDSSLISFETELNKPVVIIKDDQITSNSLKSCINIQLLYGNDNTKKYIGGMKIPISNLFSSAQSSIPLDIEFRQLEFELWDYDQFLVGVTDVDEEGKSYIHESNLCTLSFEAAAPIESLETWKKIKNNDASAIDFVL